MRLAPTEPTTEDLSIQFQLANNAEDRIIEARLDFKTAIDSGFIGYLGSCTLPDDPANFLAETTTTDSIQQNKPGLHTGSRACPWKPRSNPAEPFWGRETVDPAGVYGLLVSSVNNGANLVMEAGDISHIERYGRLVVAIWVGARSFGSGLAEVISDTTPELPLLIKNPVSGEIDETIRHAEKLKRRRGEDAAPVLPIYRGGENARTPKQWEKVYKRFLDLTEGHLIVDFSHGGGRAHDPNVEFERTRVGQARCIDHGINLAQQGYVPAGGLIEASDMEEIIDPHVPFTLGLDAIKELYSQRIKSI